jgi:K+-sensing histidine kinase KdpD
VQGYLPKLDQEDEVSEPILMVLIKNITVKKRLKNLQVESQFQNMLLQSFSHELRTPLNCSNQMLTVAQDLIKGDLLLSKLIRQAMASNLLLIYQLNDILDFAALECDKFTYKWDTMNWGLIIEEINELYRDACQDKNLDFEIIDNTNDE